MHTLTILIGILQHNAHVHVHVDPAQTKFIQLFIIIVTDDGIQSEEGI